jgi:hypothetical protein
MDKRIAIECSHCGKMYDGEKAHTCTLRERINTYAVLTNPKVNKLNREEAIKIIADYFFIYNDVLIFGKYEIDDCGKKHKKLTYATLNWQTVQIDK